MRRTLEAWTRDFTRAGRSLLRAPGFTLVAGLTLALAIGANTAIFSVVDAVLLDPLAFPDPDRLVVVRGTAPGSDLPEEFPLGPEFYLQYKESARALDDLAFAQFKSDDGPSGRPRGPALRVVRPTIAVLDVGSDARAGSSADGRG